LSKKKKTGKNYSMKTSVDYNKLVDSSKMWLLISLDEKGLHFNSSADEEGIVLISLALSSNDEMWKIVKEHTEKLRLTKQKKQN
jgi:hypothetical protein